MEFNHDNIHDAKTRSQDGTYDVFLLFGLAQSEDNVKAIQNDVTAMSLFEAWFKRPSAEGERALHKRLHELGLRRSYPEYYG